MLAVDGKEFMLNFRSSNAIGENCFVDLLCGFDHIFVIL